LLGGLRLLISARYWAKMTDNPKEVTKTRMENALHFLATSDETEAQLHSLYESNKNKTRAKFDTVAAYSEGGNEAKRNAAAYEHEDYKSAKAAELLALTEWCALKNRRSTANMLIDVWRSLNAARNKGQIT